MVFKITYNLGKRIIFIYNYNSYLLITTAKPRVHIPVKFNGNVIYLNIILYGIDYNKRHERRQLYTYSSSV